MRQRGVFGLQFALALEIEPHFAEEAEQIRRRKISESRRNEMVENVPPSQKSRDQAASAVGISGKLVSAAKAMKMKTPQGHSSGCDPRARASWDGGRAITNCMVFGQKSSGGSVDWIR